MDLLTAINGVETAQATLKNADDGKTNAQAKFDAATAAKASADQADVDAVTAFNASLDALIAAATAAKRT